MQFWPSAEAANCASWMPAALGGSRSTESSLNLLGMKERILPRLPTADPGASLSRSPSKTSSALFRGRRTPIKAALLNQSLLHGVGNIYADESLFRAGIRPRRQAARLTRAELDRLRTALIEVLHHAIKLGGSSVSDYVDADGVRGFFQLEHKVYMRTGKPCLVCKTPIQKITLAGRSTHFCPACQK